MESALSRRAVLAALAAGCAVLWLRAASFESGGFLSARPPARWLLVDGAAQLKARPEGPRFARFRARFEAGTSGVQTAVDVRATGASEVALDGRVVAEPGDGGKSVRRVALSAGPGPHELDVVVRAESGPPAAWAQAPELGLYSGPRWEASGDDGATWAPARDAELPPIAPQFAALPSAASGFLSTFLWTAPFLLLGALLSRRARRFSTKAEFVVAAGAWLLLAWAALAFLPSGVGYDSAAHADYAARLWRNSVLPGPGDGWQTFQAPLYYALAAPLWAAAQRLGRDPEIVLRLPNLFAGFVLGWASRRFVAAARPGRPDLALAAGLFGWFWPASLYVAQTPGGEPLAGALAALLLAECARAGVAESPLRPGRAALLGALCGAALLAKTTAVLALPPALFLLWPVARRGRSLGAPAAAFAAAALAVGGWWYARNWMLYGAPFVGGWDPTRGIRWSQDPGYRMTGDFLRFGAALTRPFYAGLNGFWDALYSTFWCDGWQSGMTTARSLPPRPLDWQAAGAWWGLVPTALLALGVRRALARRDAASGAALLGIFVGVLALARLFLAVPIYSTVKASYLLGLAPLFALFLADGLDALDGAPRAAAWAAALAWAAVACRAALPL